MRSQIHIRVTDEKNVCQFACTIRKDEQAYIDGVVEGLLEVAQEYHAHIIPELNLADYSINGVKIEKTKDERTTNL